MLTRACAHVSEKEIVLMVLEIVQRSILWGVAKDAPKAGLIEKNVVTYW